MVSSSAPAGVEVAGEVGVPAAGDRVAVQVHRAGVEVDRQAEFLAPGRADRRCNLSYHDLILILDCIPDLLRIISL